MTPTLGYLLALLVIVFVIDFTLRALPFKILEPLRDSRFRTWPAGDTYVVYPGGRSSIRFERLREGIQDAEKIRILRAEAGRGNSAGADEKRARLEAVIAPFASREPAADLHERLAEAKRVLNEL